MADPSSPPQSANTDSFPPPPPPPSNTAPPSSVGRMGSRERSPSPRHSPSHSSRYYDDRRSYRDDDRYGGGSGRDRYESYPRRGGDYHHNSDRGYSDRGDRYDQGSSRYNDRYDNRDRYDHRDRYDRNDRYNDRRGGRDQQRSRRKPVARGTEQERKASTTIYAGNLPYDFIESDVATMFERYGRLKSVTVPLDSVTQKNKGFAFVEYEERRDAEDAFGKFDGFSVEGRRLRLDWDIGLSKKDNDRQPRRQPNSSMDDPRDRSMNDPYSAPPPPPMESRGYRRDSPEPYRR